MESPLGGFLSLPATETDLWTQQAITTQTVEKFLPEKLLRLSEWVAAHSQSFTEEFSCVLEDKGVEHRKNNDTKASTINHSTRKRRKTRSSNKTNSTIGGQDTLHHQFTRGENKE
ncbi:hypothetical protein NIES4106_50560 [Fischerella sp. NIES-4106]|nr:hypothetical protein NIES4106_35610 [Fischerella sp. NIES-4106]BAZ70265.1 hypothetical protein NIES4106_50560 [Fischerella sp. NIES-4106]